MSLNAKKTEKKLFLFSLLTINNFSHFSSNNIKLLLVAASLT